jgi:hypothetical protein
MVAAARRLTTADVPKLVRKGVITEWMGVDMVWIGVGVGVVPAAPGGRAE